MADMSQSSVQSDAEQVIALFIPGTYILGQLCHMWQRVAPLHLPAVLPVLGVSLPYSYSSYSYLLKTGMA